MHERLVVQSVPDLLRTVNLEFDISAALLKPFGPIWRVHSAKGAFGLKRTGSSAKRLIRIGEILSQIYEAGFRSLILPEISKNKLPYFEFDNHYYQLFRWRQGNHPSFTETESIKECVRFFAGLHRISNSVLKSEECKTKDLIADLEQRTVFLEKTISLLKKKSPINRIDRGMLRWCDYFLAQARYSLSGLEEPDKSVSCSTLIGFCHNDPAVRNIIVENGQWFLIDFELSATGLLVTETAKLACRILQSNDWRPQIFDLIIDAYNRERTITNWEQKMLPYLICFPHSFWRICRQRFEEKLKWRQRRFADRFWKITNAEPQRLLLLRSILPGFDKSLCRFPSIPHPGPSGRVKG